MIDFPQCTISEIFKGYKLWRKGLNFSANRAKYVHIDSNVFHAHLVHIVQMHFI